MLSLAIATALSFAAPPCDIALVSELLAPDSDWRTAQDDVISMAVHLGARLPKRIAARLAPCGGTAAKFAQAVDQDEVAATILRAAIQLESEQVEATTRASYLAWADCIKPLPVADIPVQMYEELDAFADANLAKLFVPEPCPPPVTKWLPRAVQNTPPADFTPKCLTDLLSAEGLELMSQWLLEQMRYLSDIEANGSKAQRRCNDPLALGQDMFKPEARGIVWDLRRLDEGIIVPVDFDAPIESHLNLELLREELKDWPDQELLSFLLEGVRYKADVEHQIVLLPHLVSLREGYTSLLEEVAKYTSAGWYGLFSHPPFLPFRAVPKGSVPRKLEPLRPRPTTEAGAPRQLLFDTEGKPVISLNEASSGKVPQAVAEATGSEVSRSPSQAWPKENKPTLADVLTTLALFSFLAAQLSLSVYTAADDFKNFFNQLRLAPEEFWKCGMILSELGDPRYAAEYIMTFGLRPASNIAQRFADAIVSIWRRRMLEAEITHTEALMETDPDFAAWVQSRGGPSAATAALFAVFIYTDDPIFIIVGALRMARGLHIWTTLCKQVGLLMAIETKRQCGTHVEWLGAGISSLLAMAWVPKHKIAAALAKIEVTLAGNSTMQMYHSLLGLLEHLVYLNGMKRRYMYYLWLPFQTKTAVEPNRIVQLTAKMRVQLHKWKTLLLTRPGISALRTVHQATTQPGCTTLTAYSDAFRDRDDDRSGMGGWFHGSYWSVQLTSPHTRIPIAALEFIAALTSIVSFAALLPTPSSQPTLILHFRVDALSTPFILTDDCASSPMMVALHSFILTHDVFTMWSPSLVVSHVPGVGNEFSDAASRDEIPRLYSMAAHLRVSPTLMEPHPVYHELLAIALDAL